MPIVQYNWWPQASDQEPRLLFQLQCFCSLSFNSQFCLPCSTARDWWTSRPIDRADELIWKVNRDATFCQAELQVTAQNHDQVRTARCVREQAHTAVLLSAFRNGPILQWLAPRRLVRTDTLKSAKHENTIDREFKQCMQALEDLKQRKTLHLG